MAVQDVLIGPGRLYVAPTGTANPDETTVAYGGTWTSWTDLGDFPEGAPLTISIDEEVVKVYGEQSTGVKKQSRTRREMLVSGSLLEHTVANWVYLLGGSSSTVAQTTAQKPYSQLPFGVNADVTEWKFGIEALRKDTAGTNQPVRWFLHKGSIRFAGEVQYAKGEPTAMPFEITVIEDDTQAAGEELGILQIVTGPTG